MYTFEKIYLQDTAEVRTLLDSVWEDTYVDCLTPLAMKRIGQNWSDLKEMASEEELEMFCIAAIEEKEIVGIAIAYKIDKNVEIKRLYVLPGQQGKGIGKELLTGVVQAFPAIEKIDLFVEAQNEPAISFYKKQQFVTIEEVEKEKNGQKIQLKRMEFSLK